MKEQETANRASLKKPLQPLNYAIQSVVAILIIGIILVVSLGDKIGVQLEILAPIDEAHATSPVTIQFSEAMNQQSVIDHFFIDPPVTGDFVWTGSVLRFTPLTAFIPGESYTLRLEAGAESQSGREILNDYELHFQVLSPRITYLYPADSNPQNIWIVDPADPNLAEQVTHSASGIFDYAPSPNGMEIAFSEWNNVTGTANISLLNLDTGETRLLTDCSDSFCTAPNWRPDGQAIVYERIDKNTGLGIGGSSPTRIWLIDLSTEPASNRPLFQDSQLVGFNTQWSRDGRRIALYNGVSSEIFVYDFEKDETFTVSSSGGSSGALSPDGSLLAFFDLETLGEEGMRSDLRIENLDQNQILDWGEADDSGQNQWVSWRPDGTTLAVARTASSSTRDAQIYLVNPEDGTAEALTTDSHYSNSSFWWDPTGSQLLIQRFPLLDENGQTNSQARLEVWIYDLESQSLTKLITNGFAPRWLP